MRKFLGYLFFLAAVLIPSSLLAHEGHHHVMGTVTAVDVNHVEVKTTDGKVSSIPLVPTTKYYKGSKGKSVGAASDVTVSTRVMIDLAKDGSASEVRLPSGKTTSSPKM